MKKFLIFCCVVLIIGFSFGAYHSYKESQFKQKTTKEKAELIVSVYGDMNFSSEKIYYANEKADKDVSKNEYHLFIAEEIEAYEEVIKELNKDKKTYFILSKKGVNASKIIEDLELDIPFYDIVTKKDIEITVYMYGGRYDKNNESYKATTLAGNFPENSLEIELEKFLIEYKKTATN